MKRLSALIAVLLASSLSAFAQTTINGSRTILGNWDASGANTTKACKAGTSTPGACVTGECFFDTDATAGRNLFLCTSGDGDGTSDTWTEVTGTGASSPSGTAKRLAQFDADGTGVENSIISGATAGQVTVLGRIAIDADGDGTLEGCASSDDSTSNRWWMDKDCDSTQDSGENFLDNAGTMTGLTGDTGGTTTGATITVAGGTGITTTRASDTITVASNRYAASFTTQTSVTVTGATHNIGTANLRVQCWDNSSPRNLVEPDKITIDDTSKDVVITFFAAQSGKCYIE